MTTYSIVTGASNGIGLELAKQLAARSHNLILVSRDDSKLRNAAAAISELYPLTLIHTLAVDLATPEAAQRVFDFAQELGADVDVLVNNAGVGLYGDHLELDPERLAAMLRLNISSLCQLCSLFGQRMKAARKGWILNIASTAAYQPTPFFAAYGASKAFVLSFSEALAKELEDFGVTVSCLSPGPTDTAFFGEIDRHGVDAGHFDRSARHTAAYVARVGIDALLSGRLSKIVGTKNFWRAFSARLAPRAVVASYAKALMRSSSVGTGSARPQLTGR